MSLDRLNEPNLVKRILLSEIYNNKTNDHDVALLKLASPVSFNGQSHLHFIKIMLMFILLSYLRLRSEFGPYVGTLLAVMLEI